MDSSNNIVMDDIVIDAVVTDPSNNDVTDASNNDVTDSLVTDDFTLPYFPLFYANINGINQYTNVLLIDNSVADYQIFVNSANASTFPVVYSTGSTKSDVLAFLQAYFTTIPRIGLCFTSSSGSLKTFLDNEPFFIDDEHLPYSANLQFILDIITEFQVKNIDYLACDTLNYPNWKNYYDVLMNNTVVTVGASSDQTGNIFYGGDWVLESTNEDVEFMYFTQNIEYYTYLLDTPTWFSITTPQSITSDGNNFYVPQGTTLLIWKINIFNNTSYTSSWANGGTGIYSDIVNDGVYVYACDRTGSRICKISLTNPSVDFSYNWVTGLTDPRSMSLYNGYLYVTSILNNAIYKIVLSTGSFSTFANAATQGIAAPFGLAVYNGYLYSGNTNALTISKISLSNPSTDYTTSWATSAQGITGTQIRGLFVYGNYIYVANSTANTITRINLIYPQTDYTSAWATSTQGIAAPRFMATDGAYMYLCNSTKISQITLQTAWGLIADISSNCYSMTIDNSGAYIYVSAVSGIGISPGNSSICRISQTYPSNSTVFATGFTNPQQSVLYNGYLYVADPSTNYVAQVSLATGSVNLTWADMTVDWNTVTPYPCGLAVYNNLLFVACYNGGLDSKGSIDILDIYNPNDNPNYGWFNNTGFPGYPERLAVSNGYLYVSCSNGSIMEASLENVNPPANSGIGGNIFPVSYNMNWVSSTLGLIDPTSMVIIGNYPRNIYVTNKNTNAISKIFMNTTRTTYSCFINWKTDAQYVYNPTGIVTDGTYLYFCSYNYKYIFQINLQNIICNIAGNGNIKGTGTIFTY